MSEPSPPPRARTTLEIQFFVSLERCPKCGQRLDPDFFDYAAGTSTGCAYTGKCSSCLEPLAFTFATQGDLLKAPQPRDELGVGTSEIISPHGFIQEIERLRMLVREDPSSLGSADWRENRQNNQRVRTCLYELIKFIPPGGDEIPDEHHSAAARVHGAHHPEWYQRPWIEDLIARHQRVVDANIADLPRINALEAEEAKQRPKGIDYLDRAALVRHEKWVDRKRTGKGRLVLVQTKHRGLNIGRGVVLSGAQLHDADLAGVYLEDAKLDGAELTKVRLAEAKLYGAIFDGAAIKTSTFQNADLNLAEFKDARLEGSNLSGAALDLTAWAGAVVVNCRFEGATFDNAHLDGAVFQQCDFRRAAMHPPDPEPPPTTRGTRFEQCDLRDTTWQGRDLSGAVFIGCQLAGISGTPASVDGVVIEDADLSAEAVFALWGVRR